MQAQFELSEGDVHVWAVWLTGSAGTYRALLSAEEKERAARFKFDRHREAYEISQGALRGLVGRYLSVQPRDLAFRIGPNGKPSVSAGFGFNKSHSNQLALYAFALNCEIGVDVEEVRVVPAAQQIAERYFSKEEAAECRTPEMFFRLWTKTEACVKASGEGLSGVLSTHGWTLHEIDPAPGYVGAVAYRGERRNLLFRGFYV